MPVPLATSEMLIANFCMALSNDLASKPPMLAACLKRCNSVTDIPIDRLTFAMLSVASIDFLIRKPIPATPAARPIAVFIEKAARAMDFRPAVTALNAFLVLLTALIVIFISLVAIFHFQVSRPEKYFISL